MYRNLEDCTGKDQNHSKESEHTQQEHYTNSNHESPKTSGKFSTHLHLHSDCQKYLRYMPLENLVVVNKRKRLAYSSTAQKPATFGMASLPFEVYSTKLINILRIRNWYVSMKLNRHSYACTKNQYKSKHKSIRSTNPKIIKKLFQFQCLPCHPQEQLIQA